MRAWLGMVLLLVVGTALAAGPRAVRKQVESTLLATGTIRIDTAGNVIDFSLDRKDELPRAIVTMAGKYVPGWKFEPVLLNGKAVNVKTNMSIRFVAKKAEDGNYSVRMNSAGFGDAADKPHSGEADKERRADRTAQAQACPVLTPPSYPRQGQSAGVAANTYLLIKADRDGKVLDVIAEQVNLKVIDDERSMDRWRRIFADAGIRQAKKWCFAPMAPGMDPGAEFQLVRVPILFHFGELPRYGHWEAYVPGPRQANPWAENMEGLAFSPDALPPGGSYVAGKGLRLVSALTGG